ncbi:MAG: valine--tRNA ligase [Nitrospirota bacterium]
MLEKSFDPEDIEEKWYVFWVSKGYFTPDPEHKGKPFSLVIPPPNITGSLHMGHALNAVLQDILSRWRRMSGYKVLWLPGTDHAGIATQNVLEKQLASEGLDRYKIGRTAFIDRVWKWKNEYGGRIIHQLKRLGASCDWTRERFTLDEGLSKAVREAFVRLYEEGLIYRDNRLISWCPRCHTALSDLEVDYEELEGKLTYIRYPLSENGEKFITVATTRPETMLGDTAVAVHPDDPRYQDLIGRTVNLPLTDRKIIVIADDTVDPSLGTGAVKVTPAHDFNDEAIAKKHTPALDFITVISENGRMTPDAGGRYAGLDRYECRKLVLEDLKKQNLLEKEEPYTYSVGHCYRCKTIIEPLSTLQWYVRVQSMAKNAVAAVKEGAIRFIPRTWENTYFAWMEGIKDWCISRQIWWGHRIPVWYCKEMKNERCREQKGIIVSRVDPQTCPYCGSEKISQDEDVLDTWFSSALWPFSTFGWPEETEDLKTFYPTSVLVTAFDIIFFWVARMIMMGLKFKKEIPFHHVYIHALIRDEKGRKMSKSKGNVVDPLVMMDRYGTDAFRFALAAFAAQGRDIKFSEDRVEGYRHFANKLWNAARFIIMNLEGERKHTGYSQVSPGTGSYYRPRDLASRWILSRLASVAEEINALLEEYRFNDAANSIYQFIWHEFCDWYIELSKIEIQREDSAESVKWSLLYSLDVSLRLLHPFMPFITEEIWQKISAFWQDFSDYPIPQSKESIMISDFPHSLPRDYEAEEAMFYIMEAVAGPRTIRGELNIAPSLRLNLRIKAYSRTVEEILRLHVEYIRGLARAEEIVIGSDIKKPDHSATSVKSSMEIYVPLKGVLNIKAEVDRLRKDMKKVEESIASLNKKLHNEDFLQRAPREVVEKQKTKYEEMISIKERIENSIKILMEAEV